MKNKKFIYKLTSICFLSFLAFISCKDDTEDIIVDTTAINGLEVITYGYYGKNGKNSGGTTIASFTDEQAYKDYLDNLESQVDAWDDQFVAQWGHLDEEALNAKEEELGFDSEKPLTDFENQIGLNSLRKKYLAEEEIWLNNDVLNDATDPDNKSEYDFEENEMAVINSLAEVKLGSTIYKQLNEEEINSINQALQRKSFKKSMSILERGAMLEIDDGDFNTLIEFNEGNINVIDNNNVNINTASTSSDCDNGKIKREKINTSSDRRMKVTIKVRGQFGPWFSKVKSKMVSYKKKGRRWKRWRTNISAGAIGNLGDDSCRPSENLNDKKSKRRKKVVFKYKSRGNNDFMVKNGGMKGIYSQNGVKKELVLTW